MNSRSTHLAVVLAFATTISITHAATINQVCQSILTAVLKTVPLPSLQRKSTEIAYAAMREFRDRSLERAEASAKTLSAVSDQSSKTKKRKVSARIRGFELDYLSSETSDEARNTKTVALTLEGQQTIKEFLEFSQATLRKASGETIEEVRRNKSRFLWMTTVGTVLPTAMVGASMLAQNPSLAETIVLPALLYTPPATLVTLDILTGIVPTIDFSHKQLQPGLLDVMKRIESGDPDAWFFHSSNYKLKAEIARGIFAANGYNPNHLRRQELIDGLTIILDHAEQKKFGRGENAWIMVDYLLTTNLETKEPKLVVGIRLKNKIPTYPQTVPEKKFKQPQPKPEFLPAVRTLLR